ncbi:MAG: aminotransferase [endosymbiont of Galathealinum brachiosum]|uniref:Glutamate-pyruvate aminotransferase AlaA n=1 Tax=endosymbiont of Galathealinum brachiosum TaxID=2200906 RepID=A0A370DJU2_9GAMM|nr:MAG: aminotransferase [endosymbiont of Galathealinum brachiosum]
MTTILKSDKLDQVCYDIRGPVLQEAKRLEEEGHRITKLNIGNPAPFGLCAPDEIIQDVMRNLVNCQGYSDSKGVYYARKAVMQYCQEKGFPEDVDVDDIFIGNGVSELIVMSMQALLNNEDEMLIPAPDYPLWTAAVSLSGGKPVHYLCDEENDWQPDIADIESKITSKTRGIVIINPNNPTGAVYTKQTLEALIEIARKHELIVFADEIYDKIIYDDAEHIALASMADDLLMISFNGLSKAYRVAGFRAGWMVISGAKDHARDFIGGMELLASMRLCSNVPGQHAIQTSLGGHQSINELVAPGGRLYEQMDYSWKMLNQLEGVGCVRPKGALYLFAKLDPEIYKIDDDEKFILQLLQQEKVLLVQGTAFNWPKTDHFRLVFLSRREDMDGVMEKMDRFLKHYRENN